ncbi:hypothetical protein [Streptomyces sp. NPDC001985]|uniref:hypothetical protein n=1 Tax=Streptomyces sp. NPDC001985 TaxID=3154406 RepID=UPI003321D711
MNGPPRRPGRPRTHRPPDDFGAWVVAAICVISLLGHGWEVADRLRADDRRSTPAPAPDDTRHTTE